MSNYYCASRTNYFRVDPAKQAEFEAFTKKYKVRAVPKDTDTTCVALLPAGGNDGSFPSQDPDLEAEGKESEIYFIEEVAKFLAPGSVAIVMEAGHEGLRHIGGHAIAIDHTGQQVDVGLNEIYARAEAAFPAAEITRAEY